MSTTTTQILFNSPALHALKRDQLVNLCKIHSIKASGKNVDLIIKLQEHARTLPSDTVAPPHDDGASASDWRPRPSEQWEVMESIRELDESSSHGSLKTVGATGEFGTGSSKSTSVSSSIKALATSLGLNRKPNSSTHSSFSNAPSSRTQDELTRHAIPYSSLPSPNPDTLPQTDHFTFSTPDTSIFAPQDTNSDDAPIPGHALRPGLPAPSNARLSAASNACNTTTIRLVTAPHAPRQGHPATPKLRPFETTFDLVAASPCAAGHTNVWPREDTERLYPDLPELHPSVAHTSDQDVAMPGTLAFSTHTLETSRPLPDDIFSPAPHGSSNTNPTTPLQPPAQPFVFGSPLPQHNLTNTQFRTAAASVLDEMNKRLAGEGVTGVGLDILDPSKRCGRRPDLGADSGESRKMTAGERFNRMHEQEFEKMDSIASHYAAKRDSPERPKKRKSSIADVPAGKQRPSGVRPGGTRVISQGARRKMAIPGGLGAEEDDEELEGGRRASKRPKVEGDADQHAVEKGKRVSIAPSPPIDRDISLVGQDSESDKEEKRKQKERDAIRRKLELNKARRRSSMGRVSVSGGKAPLIPNQKAKGNSSRFGFLSSAKSMMQSVWNRGVSKTATSSIPVSKTVPKASADSKTGPSLSKKAAPARPSSANNRNVGSIGRVSSASSLLKPTAPRQDAKGTVSSNRSRSPIPSFPGAPSSTRSGMGSVSSSRTGSSIGIGGSRAGSSRFGTRTSSIAAPSIGTGRSSGVTRSGSRVSSLGTRGSLSSVADTGSAGSKRVPGTLVKSSSANGQEARKKVVSSRLMAPTASSLARAQSSGSLRPPSMIQEGGKTSGLAAVVEDRPATPSKSGDDALSQITNNPVPARGMTRDPSPRPGGIFSKPLVAPSSIPTPMQAAGGAGVDALLVVAPRPKVAVSGRKPRISRSRVIARLASQREASSSGSSAGPALGSGAAGIYTGRMRSSLGAVRRGSGGGGKTGGVIMSAKKRARRSEYARRKSRVGGSGTDAMDIAA